MASNIVPGYLPEIKSPREPPAAMDKGAWAGPRVGLPSCPRPSDLLTLVKCFDKEAAPGTFHTQLLNPHSNPSGAMFIIVPLSR